MSEIKSIVKTSLIGIEIVVELTTCEEWIQGEQNKFETVEEKRFNFLDVFPFGMGKTKEVEQVYMKDDTFKQVLFYGLKQKAKDGVASVKDDKERFDIACGNFERLLSQDKAVRSFNAEGGRSAGVTKGQRTFLEASFSNVVIGLTKPEKIALFMQLDMEKLKSYFIQINEVNVKGLKPGQLNQALADKLVEDFVGLNEDVLVGHCGKVE